MINELEQGEWVSYHLNVYTEKAMRDLRDGVNYFHGTPSEAFSALVKHYNAGKEYFAGCDNETEEGKCGGHRAS